LMDQLRAEKSVCGTQIPPILCDYYDRCSEYFYKSFLDLLTNYLSNVKALKRCGSKRRFNAPALETETGKA
jgi:hypothetical protein